MKVVMISLRKIYYRLRDLEQGVQFLFFPYFFLFLGPIRIFCYF